MSGCKTDPSILNSNLANYLHPDVIDGHFVHITFGHPVIEMSRLEHWVRPVAAVVANQYTFHLEDTKTPGVRLAIKLGATVEYLATWANQIDTSSVMPVEPEFGGHPTVEDPVPSLDTEVNVRAGANMTLSGSAIMRSEFPRSVINLLGYICSETFSSSVKSQGA
ncbi:unnamed protein product [Nyctereutes procyonoides]|uniref:(raccoon dog) hypothetical protein n=1 Tax=Nyctereutes procyonoides TaxID=34880 RepID=A0A811ZNZ6_NYCPR|nr:unnamed protein product [Nyctereutes procyonoides]